MRPRTLLESTAPKRRLLTSRVLYRYNVKGVKNIVLYSLPDYPDFYLDLMRMVSSEEGGTATSLFCKLDRLKLERTVGSQKAADWERQQKNTFT